MGKRSNWSAFLLAKVIMKTKIGGLAPIEAASFFWLL